MSLLTQLALLDYAFYVKVTLLNYITVPFHEITFGRFGVTFCVLATLMIIMVKKDALSTTYNFVEQMMSFCCGKKEIEPT